MKNTKMLLALAISMMSIINADDTQNDPHVLPLSDFSAIKVSTNDASEDGNILHKIISHYGKEDEDNFELSFIITSKIFAEMKTFKKDSHLDEEATEKRLIENLKALLSGKDNNGRTPIELARELKKTNNDFYQEVETGLIMLEKNLEQSANGLTPEQRRAQELQFAMLMMALNNR